MPSALAVFACRPNSHPFQERHVYLDEPVKIGRSVARCRPAQNNATFDCKVLSRNHALVWFDHKSGKFYLQDTKSSNGTFINSQRLSRGSEESPPCEVLSGDIIQFGVDVTENTRKVTHGCIVSTVKLFLPDGMEARRRSDVIQAPLPLPVDKVAANTPSMYSQELFQLSQYLQEALHREQMLEQKLATLQRLLTTTQEASESSWQALIDEDRLLSRLEVMGSQLQAYSKSQTEDGIRKELLALQEDKHNYETTAKESLRRVLQEKIEVVRKLSEVERTLSNTEDECTHLKEMSERGHEELRELANKYNAAVNEIKELTDKIKAAEGRQEELTQRGASEKRELELRIEEMEEKEQVLQARVEALQADNDFTNERLAALQVRLEQLQEKSVKENSSLDEDEAPLQAAAAAAEDRPVEDKPNPQPAPSCVEAEEEDEDDEDTDTDDGAVGGDMDDNCHLNNSGGDATRIQQLIECPPVKQLKEAVSSSIHKLANFDDAHLQNNQTAGDDILTSPDRLKGNQMDAKESDMSDTLSPSKDRSSDDTSDGNMDDQDLNEPLNRVALLKAELHRAGLEPGDTEQVIHHLHRELLEAQELANTGKQKCLELQALLEEERRNNSQQTEESTKQIQYLQTQLGKLQADMEALREQRENTICSTREDLYSAQEEILVLRHAVEAATAERERDIAALQRDLGGVRCELERWRSAAAKYEEEIGRLQEDFARQQLQRDDAGQLQAECAALQQRCASLQQDCDGLREEKTTLAAKLHRLESELSSTRAQSLLLSNSLESLEKREELLRGKLGSLENRHLQDESRLMSQLDRAQDRTHALQKEYEDTQSQLSDLRQRYERTEQEKTNIHQELEECRSNLKLLQDKNNSPSILQPVQAIFMGLVLALLYWCFGHLW
ncbi:sarcolemma associated protein a isoform X1 [Syngnathoides biaculeatus]|uniref:sarcolemma associated protein a isoform X1 n=2 Tax=Syngnathoides biaculeatus TaxID=300417 RepID=UPI002ADD9717|nr:sarcolemma associated protein a isoform X1 [Syngnathoides biaculeatus]XP_061689037.1 sarcolemma associated protein a isoform X1 [Syngnathoides biaculeatus]XP_061689038.1 sarcolemma associated protein a isoform X1 [Syngnathoides biaculeatus]